MRPGCYTLRALGIGLALMLQGCVGSQYSVITSPASNGEPEPTGQAEPAARPAAQQGSESQVNIAKLESSESNVKPVKLLIVGNGTTLLIPPLNRAAEARQGATRGSNRFVFELLISPNEPEVSFNPDAVAIRTAGGEELDVSGLLGTNAPGKIVAKTYSPFCKVTAPDQQGDAGAIPLMEGKDYCFRIRFDRNGPNTAEPFKVNINGIRIQGEGVAVPTVEYQPDTGQFIES